MITFATIGLNHGHINGMTDRLIKTGRAELKSVYAEEQDLLDAYADKFPQAAPASSEEEILNDPDISLVISASINADRGQLAARALNSGKSFFVDKPPVTSFKDIDAIEQALNKGKGLYSVYWGERAHSSSLIKMKEMIDQGKIGRVVQFMGLGPHRLRKETRPDWMFSKEKYGGILTDIASHQFELFTHLTGEDIVPGTSRIGNYANQDTPEFEDFGDAVFTGTGGTSGYVRVDWFTPDGLPTWGDGKQIVIGTEGYFESRSYVDIGKPESEMLGKRLIYVSKESPPEEVDLSDVEDMKFLNDILDDIEQGENRSQPHDHTLKILRSIIQIEDEAVTIV